VIGNALDATTFVPAVPRGAVFVQLVGTAHPRPAKARQFEDVTRSPAHLPSLRDGAERLRPITLDDCLHALQAAIRGPCPDSVRILDVPALRRTRAASRADSRVLRAEPDRP
jgi:hypothetical protein